MELLIFWVIQTEFQHVQILRPVNCIITVLSFLAVKNKATGDFFLNSHGDYPETRSVIEKGLEWQYENKNYKDTIQTNGPLRNDVVIMVSTLLCVYFYNTYS